MGLSSKDNDNSVLLSKVNCAFNTKEIKPVVGFLCQETECSPYYLVALLEQGNAMYTLSA